jgi:putative hydrolase of the HAD superfamily
LRKILLLDYDHTLYPSTLDTLKAVDARINLYMRTFLGYTHVEADIARVRLWDQYGTTLKGLEKHHGVDRDHYCDFIHDIEERHLPPPDPGLADWISRIPHPFYIFTNARMDWAVRGLKSMGLESILPERGLEVVERETPADVGRGKSGTRLRGIFDIAFMDWQGKPHPESYDKVDAYLRKRHGADLQIHFADDRMDNLETAGKLGWVTIWITPHDAPAVPPGAFDRVVSNLTSLDPDGLDLPSLR